MNVYLDKDEEEFVRAQPKGFLRDVVRRYIDVGSAALTPEELVYLRDHGGTKGVIALAKGERPERPQVDPKTGEVI